MQIKQIQRWGRGTGGHVQIKQIQGRGTGGHVQILKKPRGGVTGDRGVMCK